MRIRALHLAIGDIIGGNGFDVLFLSDVANRDGSTYGAMNWQVILVIGLGVILNLLFAAGLIRRQEGGIGHQWRRCARRRGVRRACTITIATGTAPIAAAPAGPRALSKIAGRV